MRWYGHHNKTPAICDINFIWLTIIWSLLYLILIWFVITSRRRRLQTLFHGTVAISSGALLSIGTNDVNWMSGEGRVLGSYSRWTQLIHGREELLVPGHLTVHIGLRSANITLQSSAPDVMDFYYNEEVAFKARTRDNRDQYNEVLRAGSPNPILTVLEFLLNNSCNFHFENTGYFTNYCLNLCLLVWLVNQVVFLMVPEVSARVSCLNSVFLGLILANFVFKIHCNKFVIIVEGMPVDILYGRSLYLVLASALLQLVPAVLVLFNLYPRTSFEVDYGTPWDRDQISNLSAGRRRLCGGISADTSPVSIFIVSAEAEALLCKSKENNANGFDTKNTKLEGEMAVDLLVEHDGELVDILGNSTSGSSAMSSLAEDSASSSDGMSSRCQSPPPLIVISRPSDESSTDSSICSDSSPGIVISEPTDKPSESVIVTKMSETFVEIVELSADPKALAGQTGSFGQPTCDTVGQSVPVITMDDRQGCLLPSLSQWRAEKTAGANKRSLQASSAASVVDNSNSSFNPCGGSELSSSFSGVSQTSSRRTNLTLLSLSKMSDKSSSRSSSKQSGLSKQQRSTLETARSSSKSNKSLHYQPILNGRQLLSSGEGQKNRFSSSSNRILSEHQSIRQVVMLQIPRPKTKLHSKHKTDTNIISSAKRSHIGGIVNPAFSLKEK